MEADLDDLMESVFGHDIENDRPDQHLTVAMKRHLVTGEIMVLYTFDCCSVRMRSKR